MDIKNFAIKINRKLCCILWQIETGIYINVLKCLKKFPVQSEADLEKKENIVYLTFDDGPGPYTEKLLNTLKQFRVKATFFVTGRDKNEVIKKIVSEGHAIGNHTVSHSYKKIYESEQSFYEDMDKMANIIQSETGIQTKLMRFPGGSSNTCSRFNPQIMTRLTESVERKGYKYFDWNVDSDDAGSSRIPRKVYNNVISGLKENSISIVLQHDVRPYSTITVSRIIIWGLKNGFVFKKLDENSPEMHHQINN